MNVKLRNTQKTFFDNDFSRDALNFIKNNPGADNQFFQMMMDTEGELARGEEALFDHPETINYVKSKIIRNRGNKWDARQQAAMIDYLNELGGIPLKIFMEGEREKTDEGFRDTVEEALKRISQ